MLSTGSGKCVRRAIATSVLAAVTAFDSVPAALSQSLHRGNANSLEAQRCAAYIEARYERRFRDEKDWRNDVERSVRITFYSVAQVPHLFGGNKFVSLKVDEYLIEGDEAVDRRARPEASYCVLDAQNRVIALERDMR